jgi:hypothetical protein
MWPAHRRVETHLDTSSAAKAVSEPSVGMSLQDALSLLAEDAAAAFRCAESADAVKRACATKDAF